MSRIALYAMTAQEKLPHWVAYTLWWLSRRLGVFALPFHILIGVLVGIVLAVVLDLLVALDGAARLQSIASLSARVEEAHKEILRSEANSLVIEAYELIDEWDFCEEARRQMAIDKRLDKIEARLKKIFGLKRVRFTSYGPMLVD